MILLSLNLRPISGMKPFGDKDVKRWGVVL
jgi:hypothetical protein